MKHAMIDDLLQKRGLKRTKLRIALLNHFLSAKHALSYLEIKGALGENVDKSTLYRNLTTFEEAGIIHRIDHSGVAKYAFGKGQNDGHHHAHFVCDQCETVYCVEKTGATTINVPKGFKTKVVQMIIRGTCSYC